MIRVLLGASYDLVRVAVSRAIPTRCGGESVDTMVDGPAICLDAIAMQAAYIKK